jgi:hypothetical protein
MKNILCLFVLLAAQTKLFAQKNHSQISLRNFIQEIIRATPENFQSIKGEQIGGEPGTVQFLSTIKAPGSIENKVIGYTGLKSIDWVWECKFSSIEKFEDLQKQYKKLYNDLSKGSVRTNAQNYVALNKYEQPTEEQRIWNNQFRVVNSRIMIDLVAEQQYYEWTIFLRVYNLDSMNGFAN